MTDAPERIYCRIDTDLTDTGEFWGTCWRDDDGLSIPCLRADTVTTRLADAEAMAEALKNLGLREIVAGWNGEGRDQPYTPHPSSLGVYLKTNAGTVYALDAALEKWRAGK